MDDNSTKDDSNDKETMYTERQVLRIITDTTKSVTRRQITVSVIDAIVGAIVGMLLVKFTTIPIWTIIIIAVLI